MRITTKRRPWACGCSWPTVLALVFCAGVQSGALADITLEVSDPDGAPVSGFRWLLEEDNSLQPEPGALVWDSLAVNIHKSHAPVVEKGYSAGASAVITAPSDRPYVVSVLPDAGYTLGGANVKVGQTEVTVIVNAYPVPTAQIKVLVFHDNAPINNAPEVPVEQGLAGFTIVVADAAGQVMMDVYGNPLTNALSATESGVITTNEFGEALIKNLAPGKYGLQIIPPTGEGWIQTTTIEGTHTIDAWVKAGEPPVFVEFGPAAHHVFVGFVQAMDDLANLGGGPTGEISGQLFYNHFSRPPRLQGFFPGAAVEDAWVGLNEAFSRQGVYAAPCEPDSSFTITGIPAGTYQLVTWDENLDSIFGFNTVTMPDMTDPNNPNWDIDLGNVLAFRWFGTLEGSVFFDVDENGFRDEGEPGMPGQGMLLRFRDGTVYQATATDLLGNYSFSEVFPFFKWLVMEVDFLRFKATGATNVVDYGGEIPPDGGWNMPSDGSRNPQPQGVVTNPSGNDLSRTEQGEVLTQAMHLFLGQNNRADFGKSIYGPTESGGISGIVFYAVTRAEDDPSYAAAEEWEPGIPRVQVNLYDDVNCDGAIDDLNGDGGETLADRDNYPLGWMDGGTKGDEDVDWNGNNQFDPGDAIQIGYTDSWDDDTPTGCIQDLPVVHGQTVEECFDNFGTWNQIRPGVFDGGFAFASHFPGGMYDPNNVEVDGIPSGTYIVEAAQPYAYEIVKEEDKNVDFGDEYSTPDSLPPACVGDLHTVPQFLTLFGGIEAPFWGEERPLCDRKQVEHSYTQNTGVEFFFFTEVPKAARAVGFINNDLAAEFDETSPVFGEKSAPSWLPISFQDYAGNEITRVYCDEFGAYNALLPSSFTVNLPSPTGVSPHMISMVLNHPGPIPDPNNPGQFMIDPYFDPGFSQTPYTFNFESGKTTYLDTPVIPVSAFVGYPNRILDAEPADGTPVLYSVMGPEQGGGPIVCENGDRLIITSLGTDAQVPNPDYNPRDPNSGEPLLITRDFSFGSIEGTVTVNGVPLEIETWSEDTIEAVVGDIKDLSTGRLIVTRGDNGFLSTPLGVTLHVGGCNRNVEWVTGGGTWPNTPIQDAIDNADPRTLIIVGPGTYKENPIIWKNVKLQGSGAGSTFINGNPVPFERVTAWHTKIDELIANGQLDPVDPGIFEASEAPCIFVYPDNNNNAFRKNRPGLIDGFTIMGGVSGGGIYAADNCNFVQISSNRILNNQGTFGGGITVGINDQETSNQDMKIQFNRIAKNGGINGSGGVTIFGGAEGYELTDNLIIGNFTRFSGGGVAHIGDSDGALIARNQIVFNEVFYGGELGGDGGGIYLGGKRDPEDPQALGSGTGSIIVDANLIQGNLAGSGSGGGICALGVNGQDIQGSPRRWNRLSVFNNLIVNNVAAHRGGGITLTDTVFPLVLHNTVANNVSTATSALAFPPGNLLQSVPQGAGIVATQNSPQVVAATGEVVSNPTLENNIIWQNRSFSWDGTLNGYVGGLVPAPTPFQYWDLQVVGPGSMNPQYCILTNTTGYSPTNFSLDPAFVQSYDTTLLTAALIDEGGNFISVRYPELAIDDGDYHITPGSPARDAGNPLMQWPWFFEPLSQDVDGDPRPLFGVGSDIGADELPLP